MAEYHDLKDDNFTVDHNETIQILESNHNSYSQTEAEGEHNKAENLTIESFNEKNDYVKSTNLSLYKSSVAKTANINRQLKQSVESSKIVEQRQNNQINFANANSEALFNKKEILIDSKQIKSSKSQISGYGNHFNNSGRSPNLLSSPMSANTSQNFLYSTSKANQVDNSNMFNTSGFSYMNFTNYDQNEKNNSQINRLECQKLLKSPEVAHNFSYSLNQMK